MLQDLVSNYLPQLGTAGHTELRAQRNTSLSIGLLSGNLINNSSSEQSGVSARVFKNGVWGFSSAAEYDDESIRAVLRAAEQNALFMDSRVKKGAGPLLSLPSGKIVSAVDHTDPTRKRCINFAQALDAYIAEKYPGLASRVISVRSDAMEKILAVSDGCCSHSLVPRSFIYVVLTAPTPDGSTVERFDVFGGYGSFDEQFTVPEALYEGLDKLYESVMHKAEGVYAEAGVKQCVMHPDLAGILAHEAVGHTVEADIVLGGSVAAHMLGKQVASEMVTMVDFASEALGKPVPLPVFVDDEGTPATDALLIKDGILTGYMNNRETARRFGMTPEGNARAYLFSDEPLIRMRNTAILPGKDKLEDMIASVEDGYYFTDTNNGQADTTGEFMFGVSMGYEIKKGKLGRAIRDTTISGVAFNMLKTVDMLSNELEWSCSGYCGKKQPMPVGMGGPSVRCKVTVGGR